VKIKRFNHLNVKGDNYISHYSVSISVLFLFSGSASIFWFNRRHIFL